jgi:nicotinamidase-related amidase
MRQALLVIDVQESFRHRPYFRPADLPAFLGNLQALIDRCEARDIPVVQVFHRELPDHATNPFATASGFVRAMPQIRVRPALVVYKSVHSALFGRSEDGTRLEEWLRRREVEELIVTGIRTEQCCETTARHASDLGFAVRYIGDATLTFPMQTLTGRKVAPAEIRERTEMVLDGRFARVLASASALD